MSWSSVTITWHDHACCQVNIGLLCLLFQNVGDSGKELTSPLALRGLKKQGHCLTTESRKLLWMLSCIWAWCLTRADNQIYSTDSAALHNVAQCCRPQLCLSPAPLASIPTLHAPLLPRSKANYTLQKHKSPWFKKSLFFSGLTLLGPKPGFLVLQFCEEFSVPADTGT